MHLIRSESLIGRLTSCLHTCPPHRVTLPRLLQLLYRFEQVDRPAQRHPGSGNLSPRGKHGGGKGQDVPEGHQVSVRRLGRVCAAVSSYANMLIAAVTNR